MVHGRSSKGWYFLQKCKQDPNHRLEHSVRGSLTVLGTSQSVGLISTMRFDGGLRNWAISDSFSGPGLNVNLPSTQRKWSQIG